MSQLPGIRRMKLYQQELSIRQLPIQFCQNPLHLCFQLLAIHTAASLHRQPAIQARYPRIQLLAQPLLPFPVEKYAVSRSAAAKDLPAIQVVQIKGGTEYLFHIITGTGQIIRHQQTALIIPMA